MTVMINEPKSRGLATSSDLKQLADALVNAEATLKDARQRHQEARSKEVQAANAEREAERDRDVFADAVAMKIGRLP